MLFNTVGNPQGPKVLLIHTMFTNPNCFLVLNEYLKKDYYIIMPTLDGHDLSEASDFLSNRDEADKILAYLKENHIDKLNFILGVSLGAVIALEVYIRNLIDIDRVFLDGGPFFNLGHISEKYGSRRLWLICSEIRRHPKIIYKGLERLYPGLGHIIIKVCFKMTKVSTDNLAHACYRVALPKLSQSAQQRIVFLYGGREVARFCIPRLKKYKGSIILRKSNYRHCQFMLTCPEKYAEMLKTYPRVRG